jgi:hypothetical protein
MSSSMLAPHPEERRLRQAENEFADTLDELTGKITTALRKHDRIEAVTLLAQLATAAEFGRRAQAIDDQMRATRGNR